MSDNKLIKLCKFSAKTSFWSFICVIVVLIISLIISINNPSSNLNNIFGILSTILIVIFLVFFVIFWISVMVVEIKDKSYGFFIFSLLFGIGAIFYYFRKIKVKK